MVIWPIVDMKYVVSVALEEMTKVDDNNAAQEDWLSIVSPLRS